MKPKRLFKHLLLLSSLSLMHVLLGATLLERHSVFNVMEILLISLNSYILLKYFTYTIQYILRHRLDKKTKKDNYFAVNIFLGIIINALLLYALFIIVIVHISELLESLTNYL